MPPELIAQAQDQTAATITRIMLTFVGLALFCLLSLLTPDAALLTGGERVNVPFAGPVSFLGFIVVGPAVLITLRVYLQVYVEHWRRLDLIRRRLWAPSAPTVAPLAVPLLRAFAGFVLFLLLPLTMLAFSWKVAVLPGWGSGLLCATVAVAAGHLALPLRRSWPSKALLSAGAAILAAIIVYGQAPLSRPFNLFRADLSNQWLPGSDLQEANLGEANLAGAILQRANLAGAYLWSANLEGASLVGANLAGARLGETNLAGARLWRANLEGASLIRANLAGTDLRLGANLAGARLDGANLAGARLGGANLEGADLRFGANLAGARLDGANLAGANLRAAVVAGNLEGANLERAKLAGADLEHARNLKQSQLDQACGDETTKLPADLLIRACAD